MRMPANLKTLALPLFVWLAFFAVDAHAAIDNAGVFDSVLDRYQAAASGWAGVITTAATWLFWTLVVISMVWTFGMMALRKADIGEFFAEFVRFTIFTGFFWWALTNGPNFASSIYASLRQLAGNATGLGNALSPSGIVDVGFAIFDKVMDQSSVWSPVDSMAGILMAVAILVILALVGVNMLLLLASGWVLAYGGVFFLGFGGSRWTSDMAINYYKVVLGVAAQLFAMVLLVGIGKTFLDDYYSRMSAGISLKEMGVMLIVVIILLALVNKIPPLIAGIITGASVGGAGIGQFGAGAALGAAGMAAAAAATPAPAARPSLRLRALAAAPAVALRRVAAAPRPAAARAARRAAIRAAAKPTPAARAAARRPAPAAVPTRPPRTNPSPPAGQGKGSRPHRAAPAPACSHRPHRPSARPAASPPTPARTWRREPPMLPRPKPRACAKPQPSGSPTPLAERSPPRSRRKEAARPRTSTCPTSSPRRASATTAWQAALPMPIPSPK